MERFVATLQDGRGEDRSVLIRRDGEGRWLTECRLPGRCLLLDNRSEKRRDAVATVERKLIRATGGRRLIGLYRTCLFIAEASNVSPLRRK